MYNIYPTRPTDVGLYMRAEWRSVVMSAGRSCGGPREWANALSSPIVVALKKQVEGIDRR